MRFNLAIYHLIEKQNDPTSALPLSIRNGLIALCVILPLNYLKKWSHHDEEDSTLKIDALNLAKWVALLKHANASNNDATILLEAIECGVKFGPKERLLLAEASKTANALKNVEKIRKALHEQTLKS